MNSINRRQTILGGVASIVALAVSGVEGLASEPEVNKTKAHPGPRNLNTRVIPSPSKEFSRIVTSRFPGYEETLGDRQLLNSSAIVRNIGRFPVRAYTFEWRVTAGGSTERYMRTFAHAPQLNHKVLGTGRVPIVRAGEVALINPFFICSASRYENLRGAIPFDQIMSNNPDARRFVDGLVGHKPRISCLVRMSRTIVVGSHLNLVVKRYEVRRQAERDAAAEAIESIRKSPQLAPDQFLLRMSNFSKSLHAGKSGVYMAARARYVNVVATGLAEIGASQILHRLRPLTLKPTTILRQRG